MKRYLAVLAATLAVGGMGAFLRGQVDLMPMGGGPMPVAPGSGHQVALQQVVHEVDYRKAEPERLYALLNVALDPAAKVAFMEPVVRATKAEDELGHSLVNAGAIPENLLDRQQQQMMPPDSGIKQVAVYLKMPAEKVDVGRKIRVLEGVIPAAVATKVDTVTLKGTAKKTQAFAGGVKGTFSLAMSGTSMCHVDCVLDLPKGMAKADLKMWKDRGGALKATLTGGTTEWMFSGMQGDDSNPAQITAMLIYYPKGGKGTAPTTVDVEVIAETKAVEIPFKVENVALP